MNPRDHQIRSFFVERSPDGGIQRGSRNIASQELPAGNAVVQVEWSSLNYKDGLAAQGHPGVAKRLPHIPGIDAAGYLVEAPKDCQIPLGSPVIITGYDLGAGQWGGWCEQIRVPAEWLVALPENLTLRESMILGTAGFTAAQCVRALLRHEISPDSGPIAVSGATGGVGCLAVLLLSQLGYNVVAATGKADATQWLRDLGASQVVDRQNFQGDANRPLLSTRFAGAIDTVGGETLSGLLRSTQPHGCVAACGLVGG
ncbi:MAG: acryloyl-CoA reductase, partial [Planctomycetota bacterium]|nr:acryloyl-CoA reductase [Planctomycetota bacterium]